MRDEIRRALILGREFYQSHELDMAEQHLTEVAREHPSFADVHNMLGVIYHEQGKFTQAQQHLEQALQLNPHYTEAALNLAVTYNDLGKYAEAKETYKRALLVSRDAPGDLEPFVKGKIANLHGDLGDVYRSVARPAQAIEEYEKALSLCPHFADLRTNLALALREIGDLPRAISELQQAKRQNQSYLPARIQLGLVLYAYGRREEARVEWEEVLTLDPHNKRAHAYLSLFQTQG